MSLVVIFPVGKESSADAYLAWCEANNPDIGSGWYSSNAVDKYGQRVVAYLGPGYTWNHEDFPEPEGGPDMRADGVLSTTVDWPDEE